MSNFPFEPRTVFTESDLVEIERKIGRHLPDAYRKFTKKYGGAFIAGYPANTDDFDILCFYEPDEYTGTDSIFTTYENLININLLPIAKCEFGNPFAINPEENVYYIDYDNNPASAEKVADSFQEFIDKISNRKLDDPEDQ